jgi:hypothetical protein
MNLSGQLKSPQNQLLMGQPKRGPRLRANVDSPDSSLFDHM